MPEPKEKWRGIDGYPMYEVSNKGRVRSWKNGRHGRAEEPRVLSQCIGGRRYCYVGLRNPDMDNANWIKVHHIVAEAFAGLRPEGAWVLHKNDNPEDNRACNLYYGDCQDNADDRICNGGQLRGEDFDRKLTEKEVLEIRDRDGAQHKELAEEFGVSPSTIREVRIGEIWAHLPGAKPNKIWDDRLIDWDKWEHLLGEITDTRLSERIGCSSEAVRYQRHKRNIDPVGRGRAFSEEEAERIRGQYKNEDVTQVELAEEHSVGRETIRHVIHKLEAYSDAVESA